MPSPNARALRRNSTDVEHRLWNTLRARRFHAYKFRRQHPIGPFVADFACIASRIVVEADGGQHEDASDARRTAWLQSHGWRVIRFWNNDVLTNPEHVADTILAPLTLTRREDAATPRIKSGGRLFPASAGEVKPHITSPVLAEEVK